MSDRVWTLERDLRGSWSRWVAVELERARGRGGHFEWRRVRRLGKPSVMHGPACDDGHASGLPYESGAKHGAPAWRLDDYFDEVEQAAARLGAFEIVLGVRSNSKSWSCALCTREPGGPLVVRVHLGPRREGPAALAETFHTRHVYCEILPKRPGARALTRADVEQRARAAAEAKKRREQRAVANARARKVRKQKRIAEAEAAGDADALARARTGKGKTKRERAARKAARTRRRKAREHAKRSRAAKKAAATRRANAEKRARRSEASRRAWQTRKARQQNGETDGN